MDAPNSNPREAANHDISCVHIPRTSPDTMNSDGEFQNPNTTLTSSEALASLTMDQRIALVTLTANLGEQSADRLWVRYGIMLSLNGGLLAIVSYLLSSGQEILASGIAVFGVILSVFWYQITKISQFYEGRWRKDMAAMIDEDPVLLTLLRARSRLGPRIERPTHASSTDYAKHLIIFVCIFWIALAIHTLIWKQLPAQKNEQSSPVTQSR